MTSRKGSVRTNHQGTVTSLSPSKRAKSSRPVPVSPYPWLDGLELSTEQLDDLRHHIERLMHLDEEPRQ